MSLVYVSRRFTFEACHHLPDYRGNCANVHGHSYKLEITARGEIGSKCPDEENSGMVMDFKKIKDIVTVNVLRHVDHKDLNTRYKNPTAENMVCDFFDTLAPHFTLCGVELYSIKLWETEDSFAEVKADD